MLDCGDMSGHDVIDVCPGREAWRNGAQLPLRDREDQLLGPVRAVVWSENVDRIEDHCGEPAVGCCLPDSLFGVELASSVVVPFGHDAGRGALGDPHARLIAVGRDRRCVDQSGRRALQGGLDHVRRADDVDGVLPRCVPRPGARVARSMKDRVHPFRDRRTNRPGIRDIADTTSAAGRRTSTLSVDRQNAITRQPSRDSSSTKCLPRNPAAPVTNAERYCKHGLTSPFHTFGTRYL